MKTTDCQLWRFRQLLIGRLPCDSVPIYITCMDTGQAETARRDRLVCRIGQAVTGIFVRLTVPSSQLLLVLYYYFTT